ncbi:hypothetical protein BDV06DRAFT_205815 [Aspergillus oleicola]
MPVPELNPTRVAHGTHGGTHGRRELLQILVERSRPVRRVLRPRSPEGVMTVKFIKLLRTKPSSIFTFSEPQGINTCYHTPLLTKIEYSQSQILSSFPIASLTAEARRTNTTRRTLRRRDPRLSQNMLGFGPVCLPVFHRHCPPMHKNALGHALELRVQTTSPEPLSS